MLSKALSLLTCGGFTLVTLAACSGPGSGDGSGGFPGFNARDGGSNPSDERDEHRDEPDEHRDDDAGPGDRTNLEPELDDDDDERDEELRADPSDDADDDDQNTNIGDLDTALFPDESASDDAADTSLETTLSPRELIESTVFRIEATGTFATPLSGESAQVSGGTGFVISEDGYALTNAHVISGASLLRVTFPGESRERNAQIVARAECSDLAVLKVDGSAGSFPHLSWSDVEADLGTDVLAVGYPLGADITLTSGIVSKASTPAQTNWASVDDVIEHTATINPGSSGGPLLTEDYEVLGVNYAGTTLDQYYAIGKLEIERIIDDLLAGQDVYSIGLNGIAAGDDSLSGIWVYSVQAGSAADRAGIEPGDLVTHFGGLPLVPDSNGIMTMEDYCDILRSHSETAAIEVRVLRWETGEIWEGQINGRKLERISEPSVPAVPSEPASVSPVSPDVTEIWSDGYTDTMMIAHSEDSIRFEVTDFWGEQVSLGVSRYDGALGHALIATEDLRGFEEHIDVPGVLVVAWRDTEPTPSDLLDAYSVSSLCDARVGREAIDAGQYTGEWDIFDGCADGVVIQFALEANDHMVFLQAQIVDEDDLEFFQTVLDTFEVTPSNLP